MGQAAVMKRLRDAQDKNLEGVDIAGYAEAIRLMASATSVDYGMDCYLHSALMQELLKRDGIDARLVAGNCAWRVGDGDGDVVSHLLGQNEGMAPNALGYHVWLEFGNYIIDVTTYQLREKAAALDAMDGQTTTVDWCPDCLFVKYDQVSSYEDTAQKTTGTFFYHKNPDVLEKILLQAKPLEQADVDSLLLIYRERPKYVLGPRNLKV